MTQTRQLAAIMFTDIIGYTALMGEDEQKALELLRKNRSLHKSIIKKHSGNWLKEMGDGVLASFQTISDAVSCAIEIQKECSNMPDYKLRIGIHQGEVAIEEGDVFGDGVNIASRIEKLSPAGGIYISESVYRNIQNKDRFKAEFVREETLKNVAHPVRIYSVDIENSEIFTKYSSTEINPPIKENLVPWKRLTAIAGIIIIAALAIYFLLQKKDNNIVPNDTAAVEDVDRSIAVLPFTNMSNDPEQEYFSDGMMEEILNHLFQIGDLLVTSRTSVMQYKATTKTIPQIASELQVNTILEGSVRKSGDRVRITVQLIDGKTDKHLWSETFDRKIDDVFAIQSEVAKSIASTLKAEIHPEVELRIESPPTQNLEAYNLELEARKLSYIDAEDNKKGIRLLERAIELDPEYSMPYFGIGFRLQAGGTFQATDGGMDPQKAKLISRPYFEKAISLNPDNGIAHQFLANSLLWFDWDFEGAQREYEEVKRIYPNGTWTDYLLATGKFDQALEEAKHFMEINPSADLAWVNLINASFYAGKWHESLTYIQKALNDTTKGFYEVGLVPISQAYMYLGQYEEALNIVDLIKEKLPELDAPRVLGVEAIANYYMGNIDEVSRILEKLKTHSLDNAGGSPAFYISMIYSAMNQIDNAFEWLEKSFTDREVEMYWLKVDPVFEPLHDDTRWQEMLDKIGFPKFPEES